MGQHGSIEQVQLKLDKDLEICLSQTYVEWKKLNKQQPEDLEKQVPESMKKQLSFQDRISLRYFPTKLVFAILSKLAYQKKEEIQQAIKEEFPDNKWQLFACARNKNGYYGAVFVNSDNTQAVIAHRGTELTDIGDLTADIQAVAKNEHHPQIDSAITFTFLVKDLVYKINPKICISVTGHSLGGFLGQLSTFAVKYLKPSEKGFQIIPNTTDGYHAHCVVFESPGCERMLRKLKDMDFRLDSFINYDHLDITNYVSAPNLINTRNLHIGTVYRIFPDLTKTTYLKYSLDSHSMANIVNVFKENIKKIEKVRDWPLSKNILRSNEYNRFFTQAHKTNNFHPEQENYKFNDSIRYWTKEYDSNISPISIFTQQELFLLHTWKHLKMPNLKLEKLEKFVEENKLNDYQYLLREVEIKTTELNCKELDKLISFIKLIPMFYPNAIAIIKQQAMVEPWILKQMILSESDKYIEHLNSLIQKDITFRNVKALKEFIVSSEVVLQVKVGDKNDTGLESCWVRNVLNQLDHSQQVNETGTEEADTKKVFLHWKQLLDLEKFADLKEIFESNPSVADYVIVEYPFQIPGDETLRKTMLNISKNSNIKKIIFVTKKENKIGENVKIMPKIDGNQVRIQFADLTLKWQDCLLKKELLDFENEKFTLCQVLGIKESTSDRKKNDLVSQKMLKQLLSGDWAPVEVEYGLLNKIDVKGSCEQVYQDVTAEKLLRLLLSEGNDQPKLCYITGICQEEFLQNLAQTKEQHQEIQNSFSNKNILISEQEQFQQICMKHPDRTILWFQFFKQSIQCRMIYDSRLYIKRSFKSVVIENEIKREMTRVTDKFIIINEKKVAETVGSNQSFPSTVVMVRNEEEAAVEFDKHANRITGHGYDNSGVHWIECDDRGRLIWKGSKGNLQLIKRFVDRKNVVFVDEAEFVKKLGRVTIITDEPGMGKTTSLASFCRNIRSSWVIRITLRYCQNQISELPKTLHISDVVDFLQKNTRKLNNDRVRELFQLSLENNTVVRSVLLFDGFDEMSQSAHKKTLELFKFFQQKTKARICITTRKNTSHILENALSVFCIGFQEVTEEQQLSFLSRKWKMRLEFNGVIFRDEENKRLHDYTRQVLETTRNVLGNDVCNFMGIPLQLVMLAEVQRPRPEHLFSTTQQPFSTHLPFGNILDLYEAFIDKKCDIFFRKMGQNSAMSEMFGTIFKRGIVKEHSHLAIQMLFPGSVLSKKSNHEGKPFSNRKKFNLNKIGLVQSDDEHFQFVHKTFAEYFVAFFVYNSLKKIKLFEISDPLEPYRLLMGILLQDKHKVIRLFLNDFLSRSKMPGEKLEFHRKQIGELLRKERQIFFDNNNQTSLHVCAAEQTKYILRFILGVFQYETEDEEVLSFIISVGNETLFRSTALYNAAGNKKDHLLKEWRDFLEKCPNKIVERVLLATVSSNSRMMVALPRIFLLEFLSQKEGFLKSFCDTMKDKRNVLYYTFFEAARHNEQDKLRKCLRNADSDAERHFLMSARDVSNQTALHIAAKSCSFSAFEFLIKQKVPFKFTESYINQRDMYDRTPLWYIDNEKTVLKSVDIVFKEWEAPLHLAAEKGFEKVTSMLLEKGADVNAVDREGQAALHLAAAKGHKEICSILLDKGAHINSCDTHNQTALHNAAIHGKEEICLLLLSRKADENIVDIQNNTASDLALINGHKKIVSLIYKFQCSEI